MTTAAEADAEFRRMMQARENSARARYKALHGSTSVYRALLANTSPLIHDDGWDPIEYLTEEERDALN